MVPGSKKYTPLRFEICYYLKLVVKYIILLHGAL